MRTPTVPECTESSPTVDISDLMGSDWAQQGLAIRTDSHCSDEHRWTCTGLDLDSWNGDRKCVLFIMIGRGSVDKIDWLFFLWFNLHSCTVCMRSKLWLEGHLCYQGGFSIFLIFIEFLNCSIFLANFWQLPKLKVVFFLTYFCLIVWNILGGAGSSCYFFFTIQSDGAHVNHSLLSHPLLPPHL